MLRKLYFQKISLIILLSVTRGSTATHKRRPHRLHAVSAVLLSHSSERIEGIQLCGEPDLLVWYPVLVKFFVVAW